MVPNSIQESAEKMERKGKKKKMAAMEKMNDNEKKGPKCRNIDGVKHRFTLAP